MKKKTAYQIYEEMLPKLKQWFSEQEELQPSYMLKKALLQNFDHQLIPLPYKPEENPMKTKKLKYEVVGHPDLICNECGEKYGKYSVGCSTMHIGKCDVCGKEVSVTEARDWGYPTIVNLTEVK